jgi:hypothetical protein
MIARSTFRQISFVAAAVTMCAAAPARAQEPAPNADVNGKTLYLKPTGWLRFGEELLSERYISNGSRYLEVKGRGVCSAVACPVTFNGQAVFARRSRLETSAQSTGGPPSTGGTITRTLRRGDEGEDVRILQRALNRAGFKLQEDGRYGRGTASAVRDFQAKSGLKRDGTAGPETLRKLLG